MFTVALIGSDGVGKSTITRRLCATLPFPTRHVYMGDNPDSSNYSLPITRWWKARDRRPAVLSPAGPAGSAQAPERPARPASLVRSVRRIARQSLGLLINVLEEIYRQVVARWLVWRGYVVLFDRHFVYDYSPTKPSSQEETPWRRFRRFFIRTFHRHPDLVICLDAPGAVVFARKGEFTPEYLEERRRLYLSLQSSVRNFAVVDANRDLDLVVADVQRIVERFRLARVSGSRAEPARSGP
jgi:thymidylate kinase